ncbi:MAG: DUF1080 domain-containing protein [Phycisphaerales bacterium]|nr:MAG: DUF1080 domain-containing protein [Phycisphaerales bacterium]
MVGKAGDGVLIDGKDFTGWHTPPLVRDHWSIEDGKSPGLFTQWGACLETKKHYRDFILMLDFRMPTISDSGINFCRLIIWRSGRLSVSWSGAGFR